MRAKEAARILNCSNSTLANWIRSGKLKLRAKLENGYRDIDDESVYQAAADFYRPRNPENRIVMFGENGQIHVFQPNGDAFGKILRFLTEIS